MIGPRYLLQAEADIPPGEGWMSAAEVERLGEFPAEKRRRDWRLGRWTAKRLLAALDGLRPDDRILQRYSLMPLPSGVPVALREGTPCGSALSLSHSHGVALVVVGPGGALGCDLERIEPRVSGFEEDYLTDQERREVAACPDRELATTLVWTGKESVMKAQGEGLRLAAKAVEVTLAGAWPVPQGPLVSFLVRRPTEDLEGQWGIVRGLAAAFVFPRGSAAPQPLDPALG